VDEAAGTVRAANLRFFYIASDVEAAKTIAALVFSSPEGQARRTAWENRHPNRDRDRNSSPNLEPNPNQGAPRRVGERVPLAAQPSGRHRPRLNDAAVGEHNPQAGRRRRCHLQLASYYPLLATRYSLLTCYSLLTTHYVLLTTLPGRSLMDEINRNLSDSTPLMGIAINAILLFACLLLGGLPLRHSRVGLGFGAIGTILLAPAAGFGLSALLQVPLTDISLMIIFVVVGIGVDDVIVVVDCLDRQTLGLPTPQRVSLALGEACRPATLLEP
jgi:hypothetical protein